MQRTRFVRLFLVVGILVAPALALAGCNTAQGLGKDVERSGEWIQKKTD
jgi:predicted small secreted protein